MLGEDLPVFRHKADAGTRDTVGRPPLNLDAMSRGRL
jgi:hypothetical protein